MVGALDGRVAAVTGAGRGVGRILALKFAAAGAHVVINDVNNEPAEAVAKEIRDAGGESLVCAGDVAALDFGDRFVQAALDGFGNLDIVVNNAGYVWSALVEDMTDEQFQAMVDVHMTGPFRILRAAGRFFQKSGKQRYQRKVVNVSSVLALSGGPTTLNYTSAKAGLLGITHGLAREWGSLGINVNAVAFGLIDTRLGTFGNENPDPLEVGERRIKFAIPRDRIEAYTARTALGRTGKAEEAAGAIYILCLPEADYITGQVIEVSGGQLR